MKNKFSFLLFLTNLVIFFIGTGLFPLLPLLAGEFGASQTVIGLYLAITYTAIATGSFIAGGLSARFSLKRLFVGTGMLGTAALILLGQAVALWQVVVLTAVIWFSGGIGLALVTILIGLQANDKSRGKSFGLMYLARPLSAVVGGLVAGQLVTRYGYTIMLSVMALVWSGWPLAAILLLDGQIAATSPAAKSKTPAGRQKFSRAFYLVLLAAFLANATVYMGRLGTSLSMKGFDFSASAVASTAVIGGLISIPLTPMIGSLSDRLGRYRLLMLTYLLAGIGALILGAAFDLWHFWLETALLFIATSANGTVIPALATDLLPAAQLQRGLSIVSAMNWVAGILSFIITGLASDILGPVLTGYVAAAFSLVAIVLLGLLFYRGQRSQFSPANVMFVKQEKRPFASPSA